MAIKLEHSLLIKNSIEFTSDSELACEDYCIYDAGYNCKLCSRLTNTRYCIFDKIHNDYSYTEEWVKLLIEKFKDDILYNKLYAQNKN